MNKIIILSIFLLIMLLGCYKLFFNASETIKVIGVKDQTLELNNNTIENKDKKIFKFESKNARYSLSSGGLIEINPNRLIKGSVRFQPLWKKDINEFIVEDLIIKIFFGDFYIAQLSETRFLFLSINGKASVLYNNFNYEIKDNIFFIYETFSNSMNLLTLFNTELETQSLNKIFKQDNSGFYNIIYDDKSRDLKLDYFKF